MLNNELDVLKFWDEKKIFEKSVENRKNSGEEFVFLDGPPFATGTPHWGHIMVSLVKDSVLRYQTQKGKYAPRRWGWDCHGVPIEALVEKELGITDKRQIEAEIGIDEFNAKCRSKIFLFDDQWRQTIKRIGRWVDMDDQYRTMDNDFIESVWWGLGQLWNKGLLYQDFRLSLYSPSMGVPLSHSDIAMEVRYDQEQVSSPVVRFQAKSDSTKKLFKKVLEEINFSYSEQLRYKLDVEKRIESLGKKEGKKVNLKDAFAKTKPQFDQLEWSSFKTELEAGKEIDYLREQLDIIHQNIDTLEKLRTILSKDYPLNILAWTTTPWTLPGNVALTVGEEMEYSVYFLPNTNELVLVAEKRAIPIISLHFQDAIVNSPDLVKNLKEITDSSEYFEKLGLDIIKIVTLSGKDLEGIQYNPLFEPTQEIDSYEQKANVFKIYTADFVTDEDGTGIIHIAAYGPDDFDLIKSRNLPVLLCLNDYGEVLPTLNSDLKPVFNKKYEEANPLINDILEKKNSLFGKITYAHRVPIFDRDGKKVYYAPQESWFIAETKLKERSLQLNEDISWYPKNFKDGRFGKGLETAPDWSISRNRYWGNPLPIWQNEDSTRTLFIDSIEKLARFAVNPIFKLLNTRDLMPEFYEDHKTVIVSDSLSKIPLGINATQYRSKNLTELRREKTLNIQKFAYFAQKILDEIVELFEKYDTIQILFNDDEQILWTTWLLALHPDSKKMSRIFYFYKKVTEDLGEFNGVGPITPLDLHRPIIDDIILKDEVGNIYKRIPEVLDCWGESGAMPWASFHYPFENKEFVERNMPASWIGESQDQTRGWFRALHVLSNGVFGKAAFKNVNTFGLILAADGQKMSKKKKNYSDPNLLIEKYGSDAVRAYLLASPLMNAESFNFVDKDLEVMFRSTTLLLGNSAKYVDYVLSSFGRVETSKTFKHPLNKWWNIYTQEYAKRIDEHLSRYEIMDAARLVVPYIEEFSTWYIRRSKDILSEYGPEVAQCLRETIKLFAIATAALQPFNSERLWSVARMPEDVESVHLTNYPKLPNLTEKNEQLLQKMTLLQNLVSEVHSVRKDHQIRVRQPLYADLTQSTFDDELFMHMLVQECNLLPKDLSKTEGEIWEKESEFGLIKIDLVIDKDLAVLGFIRDFERAVQDFRKKQGFRPSQIVAMKWQIASSTDDEILQRVLKTIDWDKLCVEVKWVENLDNIDKSFEVKELCKILVD